MCDMAGGVGREDPLHQSHPIEEDGLSWTSMRVNLGREFTDTHKALRRRTIRTEIITGRIFCFGQLIKIM